MKYTALHCTLPHLPDWKYFQLFFNAWKRKQQRDSLIFKFWAGFIEDTHSTVGWLSYHGIYKNLHFTA